MPIIGAFSPASIRYIPDNGGGICPFTRTCAAGAALPPKLDQIEEAYDLFANQRDGVLKIAITP